jgi:tetratricopeptide (TPR) repeat protein
MPDDWVPITAQLMEWGTFTHTFAIWSRKMTNRPIRAAQRAAGPLLLALFAGCNAAAPQPVPELAVHSGAPSLLAVPADCQPVPAITRRDTGVVVQAAFPGDPGGSVVNQPDVRIRPAVVKPVVSASSPTTPAPPLTKGELQSAKQPAAPPLFAAATEVRDEQIEMAVARADANLQHGYRLAERRAYFSAKAEFYKALWLIAQALDGPPSDKHVAALGAATRALEEAEEFVPRVGRTDAEIELPLIISGHRTPALKSASLETITPRMALDRYMVFAQQKLAEAVEGQMVGSKALYLLGRLHTVVAQDRSPCFIAAEQKALVFQQAAMTADLNNAMAANELGVLLGRAGRHEEARTILQHCASLASQPEIWHNLMVVHWKLGEIALAMQAQHQLEAARAKRNSPTPIGKPRPSEMVHWVEPQEFAKAGPSPAPVSVPRPSAERPKADKAPVETARDTRPAGPLGWLPWTGRQTK